MAKQARPVIFGEVLFDHFPGGEMVLGGAPFNVAWHLQAFGLDPLFISRIGDDPLGRRIRTEMLGWGMDTSGLQMDSAHPTGIVEIRFENSEPQFDIVEDRAYDFIDSGGIPPVSNASLLYHGSLALRGDINRKVLREIGKTLCGKRFVDVNLRPPWWRHEVIQWSLQEAQIIKLNHDELHLISASQEETGEKARKILIENELELLILTEGARGARAFVPGGEFHVSPAERVSVVDTVGAGDAFSSIIILGLINEWSMEDTLARAQEFASAIVGVRGATVGRRDFYTEFVSRWGLDPR
jgi:fructokinase